MSSRSPFTNLQASASYDTLQWKRSWKTAKDKHNNGLINGRKATTTDSHRAPSEATRTTTTITPCTCPATDPFAWRARSASWHRRGARRLERASWGDHSGCPLAVVDAAQSRRRPSGPSGWEPPRSPVLRASRRGSPSAQTARAPPGRPESGSGRRHSSCSGRRYPSSCRSTA